MDTSSDYIPNKLKTAALDLYGRGRCALCASTTKPRDFAHVGTDVDDDPYKDTQPYHIPPLCRSCHSKIDWRSFVSDPEWGGLLTVTLMWLVRHKAGIVKEGLEAHLSGRLEELKKKGIVPGGKDGYIERWIRIEDFIDLKIEYFGGGKT